MIPVLTAFFVFNQFFFWIFGWGFSREIGKEYLPYFVLISMACGGGLLVFFAVLGLKSLGTVWLRSGQGCFLMTSLIAVVSLCFLWQTSWSALAVFALSLIASISFYWRAIKRNLQPKSIESR